MAKLRTEDGLAIMRGEVARGLSVCVMDEDHGTPDGELWIKIQRREGFGGHRNFVDIPMSEIYNLLRWLEEIRQETARAT